MNMLVSGIALLIAGAAFAGHDLATFRQNVLRNLSTQARMVASNSVTALLFNDPQAAEDTLGALRASTDIESADIYAADGHLFASYRRAMKAAEATAPAIPQGVSELSSFTATSVELARRVDSEGTAIGTVRIRANLHGMYTQLARFAVIVAVVLLISFAGALMASRVAQRNISAPLAAVATVARQVSVEKDFAVRAPRVGSTAELTVLVDSFNTMLAEIQERDRSLHVAQAQLEARVQDATEELRTSNNELEAFTYSVSHDLRAPLRHITGFAALLQEHAANAIDAQGRRYLNTITESANRMATLIDDLLAFSRMGRASISKRRVDLAGLVGEAKDEVSTDLNGRRVQWVIGTLPCVLADPALLRPVLVNLLSNALKYSSTRDEARIEIGAESNANEVIVSVSDNGVGFDMAYAHKLFGVFQRLHRADEFSGTGIGLANVRRIVQRHGGRTWAEGAVGTGATFYFSLPAEDRI
jgi:signal transduction histidine kinase